MTTRNLVKIFFVFLLLIIIVFFFLKLSKDKKPKVTREESNETIYNSNLIKDVEYSTKDKDGNEYFLKAQKGEIDFSNPNIIFLEKVYAEINLVNSEQLTIFSDFGKYNSENYDTIFSKNVIISYIDDKITGEYLDFSLVRNLMIISKDVIYSNLENTLKADVIEVNIKTKNTKIFMHENKKKVNITNEKQWR